MSLQALNRLSKAASRLTLTGLAVPAVLLLSQGRAEAILTYYIFEDAGNLKIQTKGSLNLPTSTGTGAECVGTTGGAFVADGTNFQQICSGQETGTLPALNQYSITGPASFTQGAGGSLFPADFTNGIANYVDALNSKFYISPSYTSGTEIASYAIFTGKSLRNIGLASVTGSPPSLGSWSIGSDQINVIVGAPPADPAPAPLPLLGAAGAFGWSRRLRRRISTAGSR